MKVLLVEDDVNLAMAVEYALKSEGFSVVGAASCKQARSAFGSEIEFVLLDVMLPDGSGYELLEEIRRTSLVPVIFLTACDEEANIILGLDAGADDYLTKPFRVKELVSRMRAVLRRKGNSMPVSDIQGFVCGPIEINTMASKVRKHTEEIYLTSLEYKLLLAFVSHPGQVLTRGKLLELLWDVDGEFVDDNALSVYIRRLREKVEADPDNPNLIKTVRGMGYKWDAEVRRL